MEEIANMQNNKLKMQCYHSPSKDHEKNSADPCCYALFDGRESSDGDGCTSASRWI